MRERERDSECVCVTETKTKREKQTIRAGALFFLHVVNLQKNKHPSFSVIMDYEYIYLFPILTHHR